MIQRVELDLGEGRVLSLETGRVAKEAGGAVIVRMGDTMVLAAATMSAAQRPNIDFFPLLVDFEEKLYAIGKIPGGFFKREGRPTEQAILASRRIDRPIRPLFPKGFRHDVQISVTPLSVDLDNPPDVMAIVGASAALSISEIPFEAPLAAVRVGKVAGKLVFFPSTAQMQESVLDLVIAGSRDKILMIEAGASEVTEKEVLKAIKEGHQIIKKLIELQNELVKKAGKEKVKVALYEPDAKLAKFVKENASKKIDAAVRITDRDKRMDEMKVISDSLCEELKTHKDAELCKLYADRPADIKEIIKDLEKKIVRSEILQNKKRPDGRGLDEIRKIGCEVGVLPRAHGSAIFSRGETQVLTVATLGSAGEEQRLEGISPEESKRYMHHYNFPSYSVGEVRPMRGPGRREIGHGALAERALISVIPGEESFPYTIRLVSEVLGSNGSTSMAATCGSTLALMDAGVGISKPVGGISVGLISEGGKNLLLTDIQGVEDFLGDMDFKVTGTQDGITAVQVDIKIDGLTFELIEGALEKARAGRLFVLDEMARVLAKPRPELSPYAPRVISFNINPEKIGLVIGPGGKNIKRIIEQTGVQIDIEDDGRVLITSVDADAAKRAKNEIEGMVIELKAGDVVQGKVVRIMPFGAFCELPGDKDGLIHISHLSDRRVAKVEDVVNLGDELIVKVLEVDDMGRINLTLKGVTGEDKKRVK